jgi:hypothetical protein
VGRGRGVVGGHNFQRPTRPWVPPDDTRPAGIQCFHCHEFGHRRRVCPRLSRAVQHPNGQGSMLRSPVSNPQTLARR